MSPAFSVTMEQEQGDGGHSAPASASRRLIHILDLNVGGKVFTTTTATLKGVARFPMAKVSWPVTLDAPPFTILQPITNPRR